MTRKLVAVLSVPLVWVVFSVSIDYWWRKEMVLGIVVEGITGFMALQVLGALPHMLFFLVAGWCVYMLIGPAQGLIWAIIAALVTVTVKFALERQTFIEFDKITYVILVTDYALPFLFAVGSAVLARAYFKGWRHHAQPET